MNVDSSSSPLVHDSKSNAANPKARSYHITDIHIHTRSDPEGRSVARENSFARLFDQGHPVMEKVSMLVQK